MRSIELHLSITVEESHKNELIAFLRDARAYYERIPGVTVRLLQSRHDRRRFIEVVEYATTEAYECDQRRVDNDPVMQQYLTRWRSLLSGRVTAESYDDLSNDL